MLAPPRCDVSCRTPVDKQLRDQNNLKNSNITDPPRSPDTPEDKPTSTRSDCNKGIKMIGKIISHLLGNSGDDLEATDDAFEDLLELEEGEWIIVNVPEDGSLSERHEADPLENLLIEHPSMSVYQMRCRREEEEEEEEELPYDEDEQDTSRPTAVRRHVSWRLAAWGVPLPVHLQLLAVQRARTQAERRKLSRGALHRQNMAKTRFSPAERRFGHFKQPSQRLYNY